MDRHLPALLRRARALLGLPPSSELTLSPRELHKAADAVRALHEGLVGERALARPETYAGKALGAYLLWWWPQTYAKTRALLAMADVRGARILDVGAGPGAAATAALDAFAEGAASAHRAGSEPAQGAAGAASEPAQGAAGAAGEPAQGAAGAAGEPAERTEGGRGAALVEALAVDASEAALAEARAIDPRLRTQRVELGREPLPQGFDLLLAANVLCELPREQRAALLQTETAVLVEPALRETGRELLELRDELLGQGWHALAPCLRQGRCPALTSPKDWCTLEVRWEPPAFFRQLAGATGLRADELLSFAGLVLSRRPAPTADGAWRVVGIAPPEKGKKRVWLCGEEGRVAAARLDRDASAANEGFAELRRGDRVRLGQVEKKGDGLRVGKECGVERVP